MGAETFIRPKLHSQRSAKRARVLLAAKLDTPFGEVDARLRDLSRKGALIECAKALQVGSEVTLKRGSTAVPARVAWTAGGRVGLEFLFMIDEQEVLAQLKRVTPTQGERFRRPGLNEDISDHDRKLAEAWGVTVGLAIDSRNF